MCFCFEHASQIFQPSVSLNWIIYNLPYDYWLRDSFVGVWPYRKTWPQIIFQHHLPWHNDVNRVKLCSCLSLHGFVMAAVSPICWWPFSVSMAGRLSVVNFLFGCSSLCCSSAFSHENGWRFLKAQVFFAVKLLGNKKCPQGGELFQDRESWMIS